MDVTAANMRVYEQREALERYSREEELYPIESEIIHRYFPPPPARLLDLGCGGGRTSGALARLGYRVTAFDLAHALIRSAHARVSGAKFLEMDARNLAFSDDSFDCAIFSFNGMDTIHPASERLKVLAEVARVVVQGGIFFYSGHNALGNFGRNGVSGLLRDWRKHWKSLALQRRNPALAAGYWLDDDLCGEQLLYQGSPRAHLKNLRRVGMRIRCVRGLRYHNVVESFSLRGTDDPPAANATAVSIFRLTWTSAHVMYVAEV